MVFSSCRRGEPTLLQVAYYWLPSCNLNYLGFISLFGIILPGKRRRTKTKNRGTKKIASTVAEIIPPITPVPTACWLPEPAPWLIAIGNTPKIKASEVIKIGRNRWREASSVASTRSLPRLFSSLANSNNQNGILGREPNDG